MKPVLNQTKIIRFRPTQFSSSFQPRQPFQRERLNTKVLDSFKTSSLLLGKRSFHFSSYLLNKETKEVIPPSQDVPPEVTPNISDIVNETKVMEQTRFGKEEDIDSMVETLSKVFTSAPATDVGQIAEGASEIFDRITHLSLVHPSTWMSVPMLWLESVTGFSPWIVLTGSVLALRLILFPFLVKSMRASTTLKNHAPQMKKIMDEYNLLHTSKNYTAAVKKQMELKEFYKKSGLNPFSPILYAIPQFLPLVWMYFAVRDMAISIPSWKTGGLLWFTDLSQPGNYLSVISALSIYLGVKFGTVQANVHVDEKSKNMAKYMKWFSYSMLVGMALFTGQFAAGIHVFWIISGLLSSGQLVLMSHPKGRAFFGIPLEKTAPNLVEKAEKNEKPVQAPKIFQSKPKRAK